MERFLHLFVGIIFDYNKALLNEFSNFDSLKLTSHHRTPKFLLCLILGLGMFSMSYAQEQGFQFIPNKGQWTDPFDYKVELGNGEIYFTPKGMIFSFWNATQKNAILEAAHHHNSETLVPYGGMVDAHGIYADFVDANSNPTITGTESFSFYNNYFLGNDPSKWASEVPAYKKMTYQNVYDGINMVFYTDSSHLKYDWIVSPNANPKNIKIKYRGANSVATFENGLHITTSVNEWIEQKPYAYQVIDGKKVEVDCKFIVHNDVVSFKCGEYDRSVELVIDPTLIFASYTGSVKDNWGYTATYDYNDNMFGGGIVLGMGAAFPSIPGAFQATYGGGKYDMLICKFNSSGSNLLWYTYLGGPSADAPLSLVCNSNNEIFVLGVTGSTTYPVTAGAFQPAHGGGSSVTAIALGGFPTADFFVGSDLVVSKLSSNGTVLMGSTYLGGSGNDGLNLQNLGLQHNYADEFRGEIIVDNSGNCYITSCTKSSDFPTLAPFQGSLQGTQDAIVCKLRGDLTGMIYGSYLGGTSDEAGYSIQLNSSNQVYVAGGTASGDFPTTGGVLHPVSNGGVDGFLTRLSAGGAMLNSTYIGTNSYDQCYNVQLDITDIPYVFGQTTGAYPVTGGVYSNPNSGQFIHKLNPTLSATGFSTVFGRGVAGAIDIVPTAFLVDNCGYIYAAGWGGAVNQPPNSNAGGSTSGLPTTPGAHQTTTDGSDFYLIVLDANAAALQYATFFGGGISDEHVDGGTSRFDKSGVVYEAVCAGCGGNNDFPTTPGAWSNTNNSTNCNLGVFKFDISQFSAIIDPASPTAICVNGVVSFNNASTGGFPIQWDFGDGTFSTSQSVTHTYTTPGSYWVYLTVFAPGACLLDQTDSILVTVATVPVANIGNVPPLCNGDTIQLLASGGTTYVWDASSSLSGTNIPDPFAFPTSTTNFTVHVSNICGSDDATVTVTVINVNANAGPDVTICSGQNTQLTATGGVNYVWDNAATLSNANIANPIATPVLNTHYAVVVTDVNGCSAIDTVVVNVDIFPNANAGPDQTLCGGISHQFNGTGGTTYSWSPGTYLNNANIFNPVTTPGSSITYVMGATNSCGTDYDTVLVNVIVVTAATIPDTIICPGDSVLLTATGGIQYLWYPTGSIDPDTGPAVWAFPMAPTNYIVKVIDGNGCFDFDTVFVNLYPNTNLQLGPDVLIPFGGNVQLHANGVGSFTWLPDTFLTCSHCPNPIANPFSTTEYSVVLIDTNNCAFVDTVTVFVEGSLYIPNTFTPNGDEFNNIFYAYGSEIKTFQMRIYNRWGQEICVCHSLLEGWDGTYKGNVCPIGVYVWKVEYSEMWGPEKTLIGHVNLLR